MANVTIEQTIALAGVCQACYMVQKIARRGEIDDSDLETALRSIVNIQPENTQAVYGGIDNIADGLKILNDQLGSKNQVKDPELTRYILSVLTLERKLMKSASSLTQLSKQIAEMDGKIEDYKITHDYVIEGFAKIYKDVISPLGPSIKVVGNSNLLQQRLVQNKVRAILLSAIRSAVLWRQLGGKRRNILLSRQKWVKHSATVLQQISSI